LIIKENIWIKYSSDKVGSVRFITFSWTDFTTNCVFNDYGNPTQITYPANSVSSVRYSVTNTCDGIGTLTEVKQTLDNTTTSIWKLDAVDYMNHVTQYKTADNTITTNKNFDAVSGNLNEIKTGSIFDYLYTFDAATGNLMNRTDNIRTLSETFTYDILNRLETAVITGGTTLTTSYLPNGNIDYKSDVSETDYAYASSHPNAVETIENSIGNISELTQTTDYNAFNKISHIGEETETSDLYFTYGVDQQRKKMETFTDDELVKTKYYTSGFEREEIEGGATTDWNYITGGDGLAAIYRVVNGTGTLYWVAKDHLGSIMGLYNQSGTMLEEYSYDAWGRRRDPIDWDYLAAGLNPSQLITRGYTMHEHLDNNALINMNGRLYDPVLGRMLSPDNFIQDAGSTQNYNRYTYCFNNPLKYIDPSGNYVYYDFTGEHGEFGKGFYEGAFNSVPFYRNGSEGIGLGRPGSSNIYYENGDIETIGGYILHPDGSVGLPSNTYQGICDVYNILWGSNGLMWQNNGNNLICSTDKNYIGNAIRHGDPQNWFFNTVVVTEMFGMWLSGFGSFTSVVFKNNAVTDALKNSEGIIKAINDYNKIGRKEGYYSFGINGLIDAGLNPVEQFVGGYNYKIDVLNNNLQFTVTNTTSFSSFLYHLWPNSWNWSYGPMGNFNQTYIFTVPIKH